jgi:thiamine-monophosphate kinase
VLHEEKIPIHDETRRMAFEFNLDPIMCALSGGEDYELLFTIKQEDYDKITQTELISVVGYMTDINEGCRLQTKQGNMHKLVAQGWNAF